MFSTRTPPPGAWNRLTRALGTHPRPVLDLTATNPTTAGLDVGASPALALLADPRGGLYSPDPCGLLSARKAVSGYYANRGVAADPERIVLTASSSEAYGWLFKLLAAPGDAVLVPAPSYPLLDALAALEGVELVRYRLPAEDRWAVHASLVEEAADRVVAAGRRVAAVVVVNPNNPTGTSVSRAELGALASLAARRGFAIVSDEVFLDFRFEDRAGDVHVAAADEGTAGQALVFSLGGLSKSAALPQLKLGWILANGPAPILSEALERLAWIADAYLSVATPVQLALPGLLAWGDEAVRALRTRLLSNHAALTQAFSGGSETTVSPLSAGWSAVLRLPAIEPEEALVLRLLDEEDLLVHPGYFFDFPREAFLVVSLLPPGETFRDGVARLARGVSARR
ncbi:MAG: pyridoxal phosphate-dependent aminotransferase [Holophagales bacterium]|nr:pyridoxal phosphate-dependent aminotransferase [Holophagales bacterium]